MQRGSDLIVSSMQQTSSFLLIVFSAPDSQHLSKEIFRSAILSVFFLYVGPPSSEKGHVKNNIFHWSGFLRVSLSRLFVPNHSCLHASTTKDLLTGNNVEIRGSLLLSEHHLCIPVRSVFDSNQE